MTTTKRAYKLLGLDVLCLEEFVAHASAVNCLKIGRKSSRVLVTGGEDHKVNLWAIGKPNAILGFEPAIPHLSALSVCVLPLGFDYVVNPRICRVSDSKIEIAGSRSCHSSGNVKRMRCWSSETTIVREGGAGTTMAGSQEEEGN
ncbi:hypothetical protein TSUD_228030 [Trifolium subterraneum]|uniref:Uncharacterized protein n=1 Tax=Trifolium subterraneum TaxID=3900 RepID=A0A2Z6P2N2_TRISU|nr:hypothetical protein TSUD_228030 [Trifolium subterraneum]